MKKPQTKADYKRRKREVKRTSQKLNQPKIKKTKFSKGNIVKLKGREDMGYVEMYRHNRVIVKWTSCVDIHNEDDLIMVVR